MKALTKRKFKRYIEYNWIIMIVIFIASYVFFFYTLNYIDAYKDFEKLNLFIVAESLKDLDLEDDLKKQDERILQYNLYLYHPDLAELYTLYQAFGEESDILVLSYQDLHDMSYAVKETFFEISGEFEESLLDGVPTLDCFYYEENSYGLKIFDHDDESYNAKYHFEDWLNFATNDDYYLVFSKKSVKFCECGENTNDMALKSANTILRRYTYEV